MERVSGYPAVPERRSLLDQLLKDLNPSRKRWRSFDEDLADPSKIHQLAVDYEDLLNTRGYQHLEGRLISLRIRLLERLHRDHRDRDGRDQSELLRAKVALLEEVIALPREASVKLMRLQNPGLPTFSNPPK